MTLTNFFIEITVASHVFGMHVKKSPGIDEGGGGGGVQYVYI